MVGHPDLASFHAWLRWRDGGGGGVGSRALSAWTDAAGCALLVLDFDGVMTDNAVYQHEDGSELVCCNRSDGMGVQMLMADGVGVAVLSKQKNAVVSARCGVLGVACRHGESDKASAIREMASEAGVGLDRVAYMGNDVNDYGVFGVVGVGLAPADAELVALEAAGYVTARCGGRGAVREVCDHVLMARYRAGVSGGGVVGGGG